MDFCSYEIENVRTKVRLGVKEKLLAVFLRKTYTLISKSKLYISYKQKYEMQRFRGNEMKPRFPNILRIFEHFRNNKL